MRDIIEQIDEQIKFAHDYDLPFLNDCKAEVKRLREQAESWKKIIVQKDAEIERLRALLLDAASDLEKVPWRLLLLYAASDLESYINEEYPGRDQYPDQLLKWKRDMEFVKELRAAAGEDET